MCRARASFAILLPYAVAVDPYASNPTPDSIAATVPLVALPIPFAAAPLVAVPRGLDAVEMDAVHPVTVAVTVSAAVRVPAVAGIDAAMDFAADHLAAPTMKLAVEVPVAKMVIAVVATISVAFPLNLVAMVSVAMSVTSAVMAICVAILETYAVAMGVVDMGTARVIHVFNNVKRTPKDPLDSPDSF